MSKTIDDLPPRHMLTNKISNLNSEKSSESSIKNIKTLEDNKQNTISGLQMLNLADDTKEDMTMSRSQTIVTLMNTKPDKSQFEGGENE